MFHSRYKIRGASFARRASNWWEALTLKTVTRCTVHSLSGSCAGKWWLLKLSHPYRIVSNLGTFALWTAHGSTEGARSIDGFALSTNFQRLTETLDSRRHSQRWNVRDRRGWKSGDLRDREHRRVLPGIENSASLLGICRHGASSSTGRERSAQERLVRSVAQPA